MAQKTKSDAQNQYRKEEEYLAPRVSLFNCLNFFGFIYHCDILDF